MKKILKVATFGLLGGILGGGKKKDKAQPAPAAPAVMPTPDDESVRMARKRAIVQQMGRRGRSSTILTGDRLGG